MAETTENAVTVSDIMKQQADAIKTLVDVIKTPVTPASANAQPIYMTSPSSVASAAAPNYVMIFGIILAAMLLFKRRLKLWR